MQSQPPRFQPDADSLILRMQQRADLSQEAQLPRGPERRAAVWADLTATAAASQAPVLAVLDRLQEQGAVDGYRAMSLPNAVIVDVADGQQAAVRQALAGAGTIEHVQPNKTFSLAAGHDPIGGVRPSIPTSPAWHLQKIGADRAQAVGRDGRGVTIGIADSGLDLATIANRRAYRGYDAATGTMDHDYNWFDTAANASVPYDRVGHGTTVAGFAVGQDGSYVTGVAPAARFIAATVGSEAGNSTSEALQGLQFMLAPTKTDGSAPDPRRGADVVNMSWGNADASDNSMRESIEGLQAAGIVLVGAAGNEGPRDNSMNAPSIYPGVISVAATERNDSTAEFSSRGDSRDSTQPRPVIAAPGSRVIGVHKGNQYINTDGTSFASPIVAGAVAVLLQAAPNASDAQIREALTSTATDIDARGADHTSGAGRINVQAATEKLLEMVAVRQPRG